MLLRVRCAILRFPNPACEFVECGSGISTGDWMLVRFPGGAGPSGSHPTLFGWKSSVSSNLNAIIWPSGLFFAVFRTSFQAYTPSLRNSRKILRRRASHHVRESGACPNPLSTWNSPVLLMYQISRPKERDRPLRAER